MVDDNIYVYPNTCNNIFVIDPNKVQNQFGNPEDRNIKQENLIYYANLECDLQPRSRIVAGTNKASFSTFSLASMNFLNPNGKGYFSTDWTQLRETSKNDNKISSELLGMKSISYKVGLSYIPTITVSLEDVKGRALFESGDNSPYSAFFILPYPTFYLTVKGYYGKAVRYPLILQKFTSTFNSSSGNFDITLTFIGYKFNVLTDITFSEALAVPQMYPGRTSISQPRNPTNNSNGKIQQYTTVGYEKIKKIFGKYKELGLVDENFPVMTIQELSTKFDNFINYSLREFGQKNFLPLNDINTYADDLNEYRGKVYTFTGSWFNTNLDSENFFVTKPLDNGQRFKIYSFKLANYTNVNNTTDIGAIQTQYETLISLIDTYNLKLDNNQTFGSSGQFKIDNPLNKNYSSVQIDNSVSANMIDYEETFKQRYGQDKTPNASELDTLIGEVKKLDSILGAPNIPIFYQFDGPSRFLDLTYELNKILDTQKVKVEEILTKELNSFISTKSGLGFVPSIRNVVAVIMASAEAFLELMSDVHEQASQSSNSLLKKKALLGKSDLKDNSPVYPWPSFFIPKEVNGQTKFELQYPGDPSVISQTKGNLSDVWPEVQFVEEFLKGYLQRQIPPVPPAPTSDGINRILISAFETPPTNQPYNTDNKNDATFLYEVWERIESICSYNGFQKNNTSDTNQNVYQFLSDVESINVFNAINQTGGNSPSIEFKFKTENFNFQTYSALLTQLIQQYELYKRDIFNTEYLKNEINIEPNAIYQKDFPVIQITPDTQDKFVNYLFSNVHSETSFTDTYPFTQKEWNRLNLAQGDRFFKFSEANSTSNSIFYNSQIKKVANFEESAVYGVSGNKKILRPFTDFKIFKNTIDITNQGVTLEKFYKDRRITDFILTEGAVNFSASTFETKQTTSILNTPYFLNSLLSGVTKSNKNTSPYPFLQAGYLFLNSLPLSTLREKYLSLENDINKPGDYIFAGLRKFGAIHRLPLFWILKIGSIWHRYKTFFNTNQDIITPVWTDFNYLENYDPITQSATTTYSFTSATSTTPINIILQSDQSPIRRFNIGFYPKLINEFYKFYNFEYIYDESTATTTLNIQSAFQKALDEKNILLINTTDGNISSSTDSVTAWSVLIKNKNNEKEEYILCPSFGSITNQINKECFNNTVNTIPLTDNKSIHNGSVRTFWSAPTYGYFDTKNIKKPNYAQHFKKVFPDTIQQQTFELFQEDNYSNIQEIFTVFDYSELELFETEFLNFVKSTSISKYTFESIIRQIMTVSLSNIDLIDNNKKIKTLSNTQSTNVINVLNEAINYDYLYKKSNPTNYDKGLFTLLSNNPTPDIIDKYNIGSYSAQTPNSVPTNGGINYSQSYNQYPEQWKTIYLYIGFSEIPGLNYDGLENFITNFFRVLDVPFTVDNIILFRNFIKIYASNALRGSSDVVEFKNLVTNYLTKTNNLFETVFDNFIKKLKIKLGVSSENSEKIDSVIEGDQSKVELYDMFKAINDKWIASNNYGESSEISDSPLFRDYLFLDRGSRNVGDILVDINKVNTYLKGSNMKANVYTIIGSIIKDHNFVSFMMPAYINFYGKQTPSGGGNDDTYVQLSNTQFANNLFGTFDTVDFQSSQPKMLNIYVDKPSQQTNNTSKLNGYPDDGLDITNCAGNPIVVSEERKRNYSLENKVVGFVVDFSLQNQGVFKRISVGQDLGKATSESLQAEYNLTQSSAGIKTSTQSVSLYNIYKTRSYNASVEMLGNVMIQPSMYFVLRNIPLFTGSYFITEVNHSIGLEDFSTSVTGTRQAAPTLPKVDTLFQTIKKELLTELNKIYKNQNTTSSAGIATNTVQIKSVISSSIYGSGYPSTSQNCEKDSVYSNYLPVISAVIDTQNVLSLGGQLYANVTFTEKTKYCIFTLYWINSGALVSLMPQINVVSYNGAGIPLTYDYPGSLKTFFYTTNNSNYYVCLTNTKGFTQSYAVFENDLTHQKFLNSAYSSYFEDVDITDEIKFAESFSKFWIESFPYSKVTSDEFIFQDYQKTNKQTYDELVSKIKYAYKLYKTIQTLV